MRLPFSNQLDSLIIPADNTVYADGIHMKMKGMHKARRDVIRRALWMREHIVALRHENQLAG